MAGKALLVACWGVFFTQYANVAMLGAFFPTSPFGLKIGSSMVGLTFAAYPLATFVATPLPPLCITRLGSRLTVVVGLAIAAVGLLLFGLVPPALGTQCSAAVLSVTLISCRAFSGLGAALAEAGCFTALSIGGFGKRLGIVMSSVEVVIGIGVSGGSAVGGVLYEVGEHTPLGSWRLPFVIAAVMTFAVMLPACVLPGKANSKERLTEATREGEVEADPNLSTDVSAQPLFTARRIMALASLLFGSAMVEASEPILQPYAAALPLSLSNSRIGLVLGAATPKRIGKSCNPHHASCARIRFCS